MKARACNANDEATAKVAGTLMDLALAFESQHLVAIRRYHASLQQEWGCVTVTDSRQLPLFPELPPF